MYCLIVNKIRYKLQYTSTVEKVELLFQIRNVSIGEMEQS